jgi:carboxyvinyl-carboxyphosphonate phosphorylmutase
MLGDIGAIESDADNLAKMGVRICLRGHQPYLAALAATYNSIQQVLGITDPTDAPPLIEKTLLQQLTRNNAYEDDAKRFLE